MLKKRSQKNITKRRVSFKEKVFAVVRKIPEGETLSYGEVACRAGKAHAARAVGKVLHTNYDSKIPCHRVIRKDGSLGGYNRGIEKKIRRLKEVPHGAT